MEDPRPKMPNVRPPTLVERAAFKLRGRWPQSYVDARLDAVSDHEVEVFIWERRQERKVPHGNHH